jgi:hypothetical protein
METPRCAQEVTVAKFLSAYERLFFIELQSQVTADAERVLAAVASGQIDLDPIGDAFFLWIPRTMQAAETRKEKRTPWQRMQH